MDKQTLWLDLYKGCTVAHGPFEEHFAPNGTSAFDWIDYIKEDGGIAIRYEIHVHLDGDTVKEVSTFKAAVRATGGRPIINEKELTAAEKKQTKEILEQCLQFPEENDLPGIIASSVNSEWNGYRILEDAGDSIAYRGPDGKKKKIKKEKLLPALHYSHNHLEMLRDAEFVAEFFNCLGTRNYEPYFAVLHTVNAEGYTSYARLDQEYRYRKLLSAVEKEDLALCAVYGDVLQSLNPDPNVFLKKAIAKQNPELFTWLLKETRYSHASLSSSLLEAMQCCPRFVDPLLESGRCESFPQCINHAVKDKNSSLIQKLLKHGFLLSAKTGSEYYADLSLDEIKDLLPYHVQLDDATLDRIIHEKRYDIMKLIEAEPVIHTQTSQLMALYIRHGLYEGCIDGLNRNFTVELSADVLDSIWKLHWEDVLAVLEKKTYASESATAWIEFYIRHNMFSRFQMAVTRGLKGDYDTFKLCCHHGIQWAEELFEAGFDANIKKGQLLYDACEMQNPDMLRLLLKHNADIHSHPESYMNLYESTLLALQYRDRTKQQETEEICRQLLNAGLDPIAECYSEPSIVSQLLQLSPDFKHFLIDWLADHNELNCLDMQEKIGHKYDPHVPLYHTISWRGIDIDSARYMIQKGALTDVSAFSEDRLFVRACEKADLGYVKLLAESGANLEESDVRGYTGLMITAEQNRVDILQYLISCGADLGAAVAVRKYRTVREKPTITYKTALDIAEEKENRECAELLKSAGAKKAEELKS